MISLVCNICGESIHILPGPRQQETKFHHHKIIHKQCYDELMEFECYMSVFDHVPSPVEIMEHCYFPFKKIEG